jgi:cysteine desulfurase
MSDHFLLSFSTAVIGSVTIVVAWQYYQCRRKSTKLLDCQQSSQNAENTSESGSSIRQLCIYCDYNATTPVYPEVYQAMDPFFKESFGNPSSAHIYGNIAREAVVAARKKISQLIKASSESEIYFVSCGTEADNRCIDIALMNYYERLKKEKKQEPVELFLSPFLFSPPFSSSSSILPQVITSSIEHPAVLCYLRNLKIAKKIDLIVIPVNNEGFISLPSLEKALNSSVALVTIMHSNNEIGTIQSIKFISRAIKRFNKEHNCSILFHSDCAQSMGKVLIDVIALGVDMITIVGHKYGAPKGIGALYVKSGIQVPLMMIGGSQEFGKRGGK